MRGLPSCFIGACARRSRPCSPCLRSGRLAQQQAASREALILLVAHYVCAPRDGDDSEVSAAHDETLAAGDDDADDAAAAHAEGNVADNGDHADTCAPRDRARQLLAVFFSAAERVPPLRALAAGCLLDVLRRATYIDSGASPFARVRSALGAARCLMPLVQKASSADRLAVTRLLLAEALAAPDGPERHYVKLLRELPPHADDAPLELQRLAALLQLAQREFTDKATAGVLAELQRTLTGALRTRGAPAALPDTYVAQLHAQLKKHRGDLMSFLVDGGGSA